mmetsp:Transcript_3774/g.11394  ORF Transcript_3774/g.11394 Transcript_3774/m.11394 type:complete len:299 (+) Transcript_3774:55-951(+)
MHVAVFGGSGFVGTFVCRALVGCGCVVSSVSRSGDEASLGSSMRRLDGEWTSQVQWLKGDAATDPAAALADDVDAVVSCIGSPGAQLLYADANGWASGWTWSQRSECQYADNFLPNARLAAAAKAAGAQRFVYVGVSSEAEWGFGGPNPGLYTGKRSAALAALEEFGPQQFTYFGPARVVGSKENWRARAANSRFINGLRALVDVIGDWRSFGPDYTTKARLAPPVLATDLALAIAGVATGRVEVEESVRRAGVTTFSQVRERDQYEIADTMRHVDGTEAIVALAREAQAAMEGAYAA